MTYQTRAHFCELSADRSVIHTGADLRGDSADQVRINAEAHTHRRSPKCTQLPGKPILLPGVQLKSRFDFGAHKPQTSVEKLFERIHHLRQRGGAPVIAQYENEIPHYAGEAEPLRDF